MHRRKSIPGVQQARGERPVQPKWRIQERTKGDEKVTGEGVIGHGKKGDLGRKKWGGKGDEKGQLFHFVEVKGRRSKNCGNSGKKMERRTKKEGGGGWGRNVRMRNKRTSFGRKGPYIG